MYYKNVSFSVKTFYGVTFRPGEIKEVAKNINSRFMIQVDGPEVKTQNIEETSQQKQKQQKPSSEKSKKSEEKKEPEVSVEDAVEISNPEKLES